MIGNHPIKRKGLIYIREFNRFYYADCYRQNGVYYFRVDNSPVDELPYTMHFMINKIRNWFDLNHPISTLISDDVLFYGENGIKITDVVAR